MTECMCMYISVEGSRNIVLSCFPGHLIQKLIFVFIFQIDRFEKETGHQETGFIDL
jgi:hypothetical protein